MHKYWLVGLFLLYSGSSWAAGYGRFVSCNAMNPTPEIIFKTSYGKLKYDFSLNKEQLTQKSNLRSRQPEPGVYSAGFAPVTFAWNIFVKEAEVKYLDDNNFCVLPTKVEAYLGIQNPAVYVINDIPRNSCRFSLVLRHEQVHQWINKLTLEYFLPIYFKEVQNAVREVRAVKVQSREQATDGMKKLTDYYQARMEPIFEEFRNAVDAEQDKLDNWVNYNAEDKLCKEYDKRQKYYGRK